MTRARAPYMEWAKTRPRPRIDLAGSNLLACRLEDLPDARAELDLAGESPDGFPPLVRAIAGRYGVAPERVATAGGCSGANFLACAAVLEAGDDVLVESPVYDPLVAAVQMLGAVPRFFRRRPEDGFALDIEAVSRALTPATRLVVVSNPHNPSGVLASSDRMADLARVAERAGVAVLVDEVYRDTVPGLPPPSAALLSEAMISTNSLTKAYGLSSLRCGWTIASEERTLRIRRARDIVDVSGPIPAERLAVVAFRHIERLAARAREIVAANRRLLAGFLERRPELACAPTAATIAFPRFRDGRDSDEFARRLFTEEGVAVVPGRFFALPDHFRVSIGGATEMVREGLEAIGRVLDEGCPPV